MNELFVYPVIKRVKGTFNDKVTYLHTTREGAKIRAEKLNQIYGEDSYVEFHVGEKMLVVDDEFHRKMVNENV